MVLTFMERSPETVRAFQLLTELEAKMTGDQPHPSSRLQAAKVSGAVRDKILWHSTTTEI